MLKRLVLGLGAVIVILLVAVVVVFVTTDFNKLKPIIVEKTKEATGFELSIDGDIKPSFSPIGLKVDGLRVANPKGFGQENMFELGSFNIVLEFIPLLKGKVSIDHLLFLDVRANIIKDKSGKFNFETNLPKSDLDKNKQTSNKTTSSAAKLPPISITALKIQNINARYVDLQSDVTANIDSLNLNINNIVFENNDLKLNGDLNAKKIAFEKYAINNMKGKFSLKDKVAYLESLEYLLFNSKAYSALSFNLKNENVQLTQSVKELDMQTVGQVLAQKDIFSGKANLQTSLNFSGTAPDKIKKTLSGAFYLGAKELHVKGYDIDSIVEGYSHPENLLKNGGIGELLVHLPAKTGLSDESKSKLDKTSSKISNGMTVLKQLNVNTTITKGLVSFDDVAFSTGKTLIALKESISLPSETFNNLKIGIVDKNDCAKYTQTIGGTFGNPKIVLDKSSVKTIVNVTESIFDKFKKDKDEKAETSKDVLCDKPFYKGAVVNPLKQ